MNSLQINERVIYQDLQSLFSRHDYKASPANKQFVKTVTNGSRSVVFSLKSGVEGHLLEVQLKLRFEMVESLVYQFLDAPKESNTVFIPLNCFKQYANQPLIITDESSLKNNCERVAEFMERKGFSALEKMHKLKKLDAAINRKPTVACPYLKNEVYRCFKGITIAKLLHRADFEQLSAVYKDYLHEQWAPQAVINNYVSLVNYLRTFSFN